MRGRTPPKLFFLIQKYAANEGIDGNESKKQKKYPCQYDTDAVVFFSHSDLFGWPVLLHPAGDTSGVHGAYHDVCTEGVFNVTL